MEQGVWVFDFRGEAISDHDKIQGVKVGRWQNWNGCEGQWRYIYKMFSKFLML